MKAAMHPRTPKENAKHAESGTVQLVIQPTFVQRRIMRSEQGQDAADRQHDGH
jgi:hypothetical protein